jgi:fructokinase
MVYALGETVLDIIIDSGNPCKAIVGGSVVNASVSLARAGVSVSLISECGKDNAGKIIEGFLVENHIDTRFFLRFEELGQTILALALLDEKKQATYNFYGNAPEFRPTTTLPAFAVNDILLYGSFYAVKNFSREWVEHVVAKALSSGTSIYYDLNIRMAYQKEIPALRDVYLSNIAHSHILKGSVDDFVMLFGTDDVEHIYATLLPECQWMIVTDGEKPLRLFAPEYQLKIPVPALIPVSTIGAGDNFNAGFIYSVSKTNKHFSELTKQDALKACSWGIAFARQTCESYDNYIADVPDAEECNRIIKSVIN